MTDRMPANDAGVGAGVRRFLSWYFRTLFDFPVRRPYPTPERSSSRPVPPTDGGIA